MKKFYLLTLLIVSTFSSFGQAKRPLTHSDYDSWQSLKETSISENGKWAAYTINPQDGDASAVWVKTDKPSERQSIERASSLKFSHNSEYIIGRITATKDTIHTLKLKGKKSKDFPKDSLFIANLNNKTISKLPLLKSYQTPYEEGSIYAALFEAKALKADKTTKEKDPEKVENEKEQTKNKSEEKKEESEKENENESKNKKSNTKKTKAAPKRKPVKDSTQLIISEFNGNTIAELPMVEAYGFSEYGNKLYAIQKSIVDSIKQKKLYILDIKSKQWTLADSTITKFARLQFSHEGNDLAYVASKDSAKVKKPYYQLYCYNTKTNNVIELANKDSEGLLDGGRISENRSLQFSEDDSQVFFGVGEDYKTYEYEEDSTILKEDRVSLDIWGWKDELIQPMQRVNLKKELTKSYLAVYNFNSKKTIQLGNREVDNISVARKIRSHLVIGTNAHPYLINSSWNIQLGKDVYLIDTKTGAQTLVGKNIKGSPYLSPSAKYINWYSLPDSAWIVYDIASNKQKNITSSIDDIFYKEFYDMPSIPGSCGGAGWTQNDEAMVIYSQYDIWRIDPTGKKAPKNLTNGNGRKTSTIFRRPILDPKEEFINDKETAIFSAFNNVDKQSGYFSGSLKTETDPKEMIYGKYQYNSLAKAEDADMLVLRKGNFSTYPDLYSTSIKMKELAKLSSLNPQQDTINWGTVELTNYMTLAGDSLQALIYKPENFDPNKKYPMMVYFYERNSENLYRYYSPAPSASIINIPYFVSNGYVVLVPDIKFEIGYPGKSAYDCIIPAVQTVAEKGYIDKDNMAIQGQSWGGYQVAYLITQTNMFKAAGAGAPVANMTSAYGGIRWQAGMSRMFQYEQTQSRIGGTLWEKPMKYIENSPLFYADKVKTPVLIMHNDNDGAVPWYQGIEYFMALKRNQTPAWMLVYNGEAHNLLKRKNRKDLSIRLSQFFDYYLKNAPAPKWMTEGIPAIEKGKTLKYELEDK
ncbi:MAG: alpha/beta hydrolase family protein [Bacteroidales bacterium]